MDEAFRVLHLFNTAGIASIIAKYQRLLFGWNVLVYTRRRSDLSGFAAAYREHTRYCFPDTAFAIQVKSLFLASLADIVHVHDSDKTAYRIRKINPGKKIVLHYHGSRIRGKWERRRKYWSAVDAIVVSTRDLLEGAPEKAEYLPNPVDTQLFRDMGLPRKPVALLPIKRRRMHLWRYVKPIAEEMRERFGVDYEVWFCDRKPVPYVEMPRFLNRYEWMFDVHHGYGEGEIIRNIFSTLGLQSLACGCKVCTEWSNRVFTELPGEHKPENVVKKLHEIYSHI